MADENPYAKYAIPSPSGDENPYAKYASHSAVPAPEPSFLEGIGTGLLDKFYGAAQMGAHMASDTGFGPEMSPEAVAQVDRTVHDRATALRNEGYDKGWGQTVGNIIGDIAVTAPLMAAGGGAGIGAEAAFGAAGGAFTSTMTPVTEEGNFAAKKAEQFEVGAAVGGVGGAATGLLAKAIRTQNVTEIDNFIRANFTRAIKPTVAGKSTAGQMENYNNRAVAGIRSIASNKSNLKYVDDAGNVNTSRTPETLTKLS
jgi:hypothetical protein